MVEDRVTDGRRIGQLLASEVRGRETGPIGSLAVVDVRDVEGSPAGDFAYGIELGGDRLADVDVLDDRIRLTVQWRIDEPDGEAIEEAIEGATGAGLAVDRDSSTPGRALVFVESGAAVKRVLDVLEAVVSASESDTDGTEDGFENGPEGEAASR